MRSARWLLVLALALGGLIACTRARREPGGAVPSGGDTISGSLTSGGRERTYLLHIPPAYDGETPLPLVVNLHGLGATAAEQERLSGFSGLADSENFIVVYPQGEPAPRKPGWRVEPGSSDAAFIRALVSQLEKDLAVDPARVYLTGISNGGGMVHRLACDAADLFAAAGPVAGAYLFADRCDPSRPVPILAFHGLADSIVPFAGGTGTPPVETWAAAWAARDGCDPQPQVDEPQPGARREVWQRCQGDTQVILYVLQDVGHAWPGAGRASDSVDATSLLWTFFQGHPMP